MGDTKRLRFFYDGLNRLTKVTHNGQTTRAYSYDKLGNVTYSLGVGAFKYEERNGAGPHGVTQVTYRDPNTPPPVLTADLDSDGLVTGKDYQAYFDLTLNPAAAPPANANCDPADTTMTVIDVVCAKKLVQANGNKSGDHLGDYVYDANGSVTQGGGRTLTYTSFNQPASISRTSTLGRTAQVDFDYDPNYARTKKTARTRVVGHPEEITTTRYVDGVYERTDLAGLVEHRYFVYAEGRVVAMHVRTTAGSIVSSTWQYVHTDHLGSVDKLTDSAGTVIERVSFDAFGQRRLATGWQDGTDPAMTSAQPRRGYTGHEQLDELNLVHMNGRIYDPTLGRFLSSDPIVQDPFNSQSLNRFSYVMNNPLSRVDPTGYRSLANYFATAFKVALVVGATYFTGGGATAAGWGTVAAGLAGGAAGGAMNAITSGYGPTSGEFWRAAGIGALTGAAFGYVGDLYTGGYIKGPMQYSLAHGLVGGAGSVLSGEGFKSGFLSSFVTASAGGRIERIGGDKLFRALAAAVVGGTASVVGGGKFVNGAMYGAFSRLLNHEQHDDIADKPVDWGEVASLAVDVATFFIPGGLIAKGAIWGYRGIQGLRAKKYVDCFSCFVAGTLVMTAAGAKPIEEIDIGELVYARDEHTGELALKPVTQLVLTQGKEIYELIVQAPDGSQETFTVTDNHPFWVDGTGWVDSGDLRAGMTVVTVDQTRLSVVSLRGLEYSEKTYNLTVADFHTFFVGEKQVWVHNVGPCDVGKDAIKKSRRPNSETRRQADEASKDMQGNMRCQYCGQKLTDKAGAPNSREYDHVTPYSKGGSSDITNIKNACRTCNRVKGPRTPEEWGGP